MRRHLMSLEEGDATRVSPPKSLRRRSVLRWVGLGVATLVVLLVAQVTIVGRATVTVTPDTLPDASLRAVATKREREHKATRSSNRFAYMFYVTQDIYGCSALHLMDKLVHELKMDTSRIDLVVLHSSGVSQHIRDRIKAVLPVHFIQVDSIHSDDSGSPYWLESMTKLNVFREWGYDRVVYLDSDGVPMQNLDHLFDLPPRPLYAPIAYWFAHGQPYLTSVTLVVEPSDGLFDRIIAWAREKGADAHFDMDTLNMYFRDDRLQHLPAEYAVLSTHISGKPDTPSVLGGTVGDLFHRRAQFIHYSCRYDGSFCKPWDKKSRKNFSELKKKGEDPFFVGLFEAFYKTEQEKC